MTAATRLLTTLALALSALCAAQAQAPAAAPEPRLEFAFEELVLLGPASSPGNTAYGSRNIIPIIGGTFEGPGIKGTIIPGGWDWQLVRADGCVDVHADYMIKTDDGVIINVVNDGALCRAAAGEAPGSGADGSRSSGRSRRSGSGSGCWARPSAVLSR